MGTWQVENIVAFKLVAGACNHLDLQLKQLLAVIIT
jgi:hypothetical protein